MPSIISGHVHAPMRDDTVIRLHDVWNAHAASTIAVTWCLKAKWSKSLRVGVFGGGHQSLVFGVSVFHLRWCLLLYTTEKNTEL